MKLKPLDSEQQALDSDNILCEKNNNLKADFVKGGNLFQVKTIFFGHREAEASIILTLVYLL